MNATLFPIDPAVKRWLNVLALAALASLIILTHSFLRAFSTTAALNEQTEVQNDPAEVRTPPAQPVNQTRDITEAKSPFGPSVTEQREKAKAAAQEILRTQAEYFRKQSKEKADVDGVNQLTPEQIDEMQKSGDAAW
jgi:hypothetical protein